MVNPNQGEDRLIVGVSGASGIVFGIQALRALKTLGVESHLVASKAAEMTLGYEMHLVLHSKMVKKVKK